MKFLTAVLSFALLAAAAAAQSEFPRVLVLGGANNHDWRWTTPSLEQILKEFECFEVEVARDPKTALADRDRAMSYSAFVLDYNGPRWGEPAESNFLDAVRNGTGVVVVHAANNAFPGWEEYEKIVGLGWRDRTGHGSFHPFDVDVVDHYHPITAGLEPMRAHPDELYHRLEHLQGVDLRVLMTAYSDPASGGIGRHEPMALVLQYGKGRVFHTTLGHVWIGVPRTRASHADPQFRLLVARGTEWAATGRVTLPDRPLNWLPPEEREAGFMLLFDGRHVPDWRGYRSSRFPEQGWDVQDGTLHHQPDGGGGDLVTRDAFADFELRFEWKVAENANSGVIYRVTEEYDASYQTGPEYQVLDDRGHGLRPDSLHGAGALYALATSPKKVVRPAGEWNTGRIIVQGWKVEHWLNGTKIVDLDLESEEGRERVADSKFGEMEGFAKNKEGFIALQDHGGEVWYRQIRVRRL